MGIRDLGFSLILFMHLLHSVSPSPVQKSLPSELMQKRKVEERHLYGGRKIEGGGISHGGTSGGKAPSNGENQGGGAAVIPVYAASANHRQNHRGAATSNPKIQFPTLIIMIMGIFTLVQLCLFT